MEVFAINLIVLYNHIALKNHILSSYLRNKTSRTSSLFFSNLNNGFRKDIVRAKMADSIKAQVKNADNILIIAYIEKEKYIYNLNTKEEKISYLGQLKG